MSSMARPGGRTARVRRTVLRATGDLLAEHGLPGVDLATVAHDAGVGKSTVYRRWGSTPALIADLLVDMADESSPRSHTGSLAGDLRANALLVQTTLDDRRQGRLFAAIIAAATIDPETAQALERFYDTRIAEWTPCVDDAVRRGEAPAGTDGVAVIRAVSAPLYYHRLTRTDPIGRDRAIVAADAATAAVGAGVFT
jgi:AcrR family transcriptional regulator